MNPHCNVIEQIINETREIINDRNLFESIIEKFFNTVEYTNQFRVCKWLTFFNENYFKSPCIFSYSVYALFEAVQKNELFKSQTEYEFEISITFLEKVFNTKFFMEIENIENGKYLLSIALVLGKYPGMQIRSAYKAIDLLNNGVNERKLNQVFEYLFEKYENPITLSYNLFNLDVVEIDILMFVFQGNNIRNHPDIPIPISKKESYILINKIPYFPFSDNVLKRSIAFSKLVMKSNNTELLQGFYSYNNTFKFKINTFINDINFWCDVYNLLLQVDWTTSYLQLQEYMDYFEYMKYNSNTEFTLKGRNVNSIENAIFNWHEAVEFARKKELITLSWNGEKTKEYTIFFEGEKYLFKEITNGVELFKESDEMKHCAFLYIESCYYNYCSIWSMKKEVNTTFKNHLTIEVQNKDIVQIAGKKNRQPTEKDIKIITEWIAESNFILSL
jgi:hypothetical protein